MSDEPASGRATTPQLLTALAGLRSTNLVQLRNDIGQTIEIVSEEKYGEIQKATIGLFIKSDHELKLVFFSFASGEVNKEYLNWTLLDLVGSPYISGENDLVSLSLKERLPLLAVGIRASEAGDQHALVVDYKYSPITTDLLNQVDPLIYVSSAGRGATLSVPRPSLSAGDKPDPERQKSEREYFQCLVLSAVRIPWPFSKSEIIALTIVGGVRQSIYDRKDVLDRLRIDSLLGLIVGQLFAQIALSKTHLENLGPLVENLLVEGWQKMLEIDGVSSAVKKAIYGDLPRFLEGIDRASTPYTALSVFRLLLDASVETDLDWRDLASSLPALICKLHVPLVRPLISQRELNEGERVPHLEQVCDDLEIAIQNDGRMQDELVALYRNLACVLAAMSSDPRTGLLAQWRDAGKKSSQIRTELVALCVQRLQMTPRALDLGSLWWHRLMDSLGTEQETESRDALASFAFTTLAGVVPSAISDLRDALRDIPVSDDTSVFLDQQLEEQSATADADEQDPALRPRIVGVLSQKGGVGKSTVAILAALALSRAGKSVCVVELDFSGTMLASFGAQSFGTQFPPVFTNRALGSLPESLVIDETNHGVGLAEFYRTYVQKSVKDHFARQAAAGSTEPFIWPADPRFQATLVSGAHERGSGSRRRLELTLLDTLLQSMRDDFDVVIFDAPAEFKDISRSLVALLRYYGGIGLLVGSLATPALMPLIEAYWRLLHRPDARAALVVNRVRDLDSHAIKSVEALVDYLTSKASAVYSPFGIGSISPLALEILTGNEVLGLVSVPESEELERAFRSSDLKAMGEFCNVRLKPFGEYLLASMVE